MFINFTCQTVISKNYHQNVTWPNLKDLNSIDFLSEFDIIEVKIFNDLKP